MAVLESLRAYIQFVIARRQPFGNITSIRVGPKGARKAGLLIGYCDHSPRNHRARLVGDRAG